MIINGRSIAEKILDDLRQKVDKLPRKPKLAIILVGTNPASLSYIRQKEHFARSANIDFELRQFPVNVTEDTLLETIRELNTNPEIDGFMVQLPLPGHISAERMIECIDPAKDIDGFTSQNIGKLFLGTADLASCTPKGIMRLFETTGIPVFGKYAVVIGKSNIVGKPLSLLLMNA